MTVAGKTSSISPHASGVVFITYRLQYRNGFMRDITIKIHFVTALRHIVLTI